MKTQARDAIDAMVTHLDVEDQLNAKIRLNFNESPYATSVALTDSISEAIQTVDWNRYPDRCAVKLRRSIAEFYGVSPEQIFAANGSNEVLQCLLLAFAAASGSVAVFEPTYSLYEHLIGVTGAEMISGERLEDFTLDVDRAVELISTERPSLTFLCSPNNTTGLAEPIETIAAVLEAVRSVGGLLCVDEAYGEFASRSALELLRNDSDSPLVVTRTFSKAAWGMAAARLGYLVGTTSIVEQLDKVVLPYHLDTLKQAIGITTLQHEEDMRKRVATITAGRVQLMSSLAELPVKTWPSEANFILFRTLTMPATEVWQQLLNRSVLVRNCSSWPYFEGCLRVSVGTPSEIEFFVAALTEILT
ncbi:MAG: histidinol-phosphate transaminase [Acidimicrobiaceae bacterium]|nr:histidinol-phosphate transaminase [Acidimicrobiaceae bacterium]